MPDCDNSVKRCFWVLYCGASFFFSCGPNTSSTGINTFHLNISAGYLESLDPAYAKDLNMMWIDHMLYNTLVETDEQLNTVPSLAKAWSVSSDGLTYTFHLRTDVYFHNNPVFAEGKRKMVARDVVFSFGRIMDPNTSSSGAWIFNDRVAEKNPFIATDDSTFILRLKRPFRPLPKLLSMPYCNIVPHEVVTFWGKNFRSHPCGTGPFMFKTWDEPNELDLLKNTNYWERDSQNILLPYLDAVQVTFVDNKAQEFLLFLQQKIDFVNGLDGSFKDLILTKNGNLRSDFRNKFNCVKSTYLNTEYLGFLLDTTKSIVRNQPTKDVLVRQAINYAINRKKIVTYFKNGIEVPANKGFIPKGMPGFDSTAQYGYDYDPARAAGLLAAAGFPGGRGLPPIKIQVPNLYEDIVNYIASELAEVGIILEIEIIQPNVLKQEMSKSNTAFFRAQWLADYPDAETYLVCFNSKFPAPPNYTRFGDPVYDSIYEEALNLPDSARWIKYRLMDSLAMKQAPVVALYYENLLHFTQKNINGFRSNSMNLIDIKLVRKK